MSGVDIGVISGIVGAITGGVTGFLASRFNSYLDNKGGIILKPYNEELQYYGWTDLGSPQFHKGFNNQVTEILLSFNLEIRNTAKIRKDYKDAKTIIRTCQLPDEYGILSEKHNVFQHAMMEPLECNIILLKSYFDAEKLKELQGEKVKFYMSITDSKDKVIETLISTYDNFLND